MPYPQRFISSIYLYFKSLGDDSYVTVFPGRHKQKSTYLKQETDNRPKQGYHQLDGTNKCWEVIYRE